MGLDSFYNLNPTELSAGIILFNLVFAFVLQLLIVFVYKKTRLGLSYSQSFIFTLVMMGVLGSSIMMAVQHNIIGAFAIFGAFTLIRFRSILKETSDLAYVFFALVTGIASGMSHYSLALVTTLFVSTIIYLFYRFRFGAVAENFDYLLNITTDNNFDLKSVDHLFNEYAEQRELLHIKSFEDVRETSISLRLKKDEYAHYLIDKLQSLPNIKKFDLITGRNTSEF